MLRVHVRVCCLGAWVFIQEGDLTDAEALASFRIERQCATLSAGTQLNYALNIYDDGQ
jgi:hypothetical protein